MEDRRLRDRVRSDFVRVRDELESLVRIPSVSTPGFDPAPLRRSAEATAEILARAGCTDVRLIQVEGAPPAVLAACRTPEGWEERPSVLLYAHHDVQPAGPAESWDSPPFEPEVRDGRLFGRGTADDKAGIAVHAAVVRAFGGVPPVRLRILIEGEEEVGSPNLERFIERFAPDLESDVIVLADNPNWRLGVPSLTTSLRGLVDCIVELRVLDHGVHSGEYGGPIIDALSALARLLATLHDDEGRPAVAGLIAGQDRVVDLGEDAFRANAGVRPGVRLAGSGPITTRLWSRPAISVLAIDAPTVAGASNQLVPSARALVSVRIAPEDDPGRAMDAVTDHLRSHAPWGAEISITEGRLMMGAGATIDARGAVYDVARAALAEAWQVEPVDVGGGGSIPFVSAFGQAFPRAALLLTGVADPDSRLHAENESVDLGELERACLAESLLLAHLVATGSD